MYIPSSIIMMAGMIFILFMINARKKGKQIKVLKYSFRKMSDFAIDTLNEINHDIKEAFLEHEGNLKRVPFSILDAPKEWEENVDLYLKLFNKNGIRRLTWDEDRVTDGM